MNTNFPIASALSFNISGNFTPHSWYRSILRPNGKPHLLAIAILSDIVRWHQPVEVIDEGTGYLTGYRKKYEGDKLQRDYKTFAKFFGVSKRQVRDAIKVLVGLGVVETEFRTIMASDGYPVSNVLFIGIDEGALKKITFSDIASA